MKRLFFSAVLVLSLAWASATPTEKVLNSFSNAFPKAQDVSWYENATDYEVHFNMGDIKCRIWYDKDGTIIKSHRYYLQNMLPPMILSSIQKKYQGKNVYGVTEVTTQEGVTYYIVLEDDKKWYDITSDPAGNLSMVKKFNKA